MPIIDASSILAAWDNYPIVQFPGLWEWMSEKVRNHELVICRVNLEEVKHKSGDCANWIQKMGCCVLDVTNEILMEAMRIKNLLGIVNDNYSPKGVDENDLICIATARIHGHDLISDENQQLNPPEVIKNYRIPRVCNLSEVQVICMPFKAFMVNSNEVF